MAESLYHKDSAILSCSTGLLIRYGGLFSPTEWPYFSVTMALKVCASGLLSPKYAHSKETVAQKRNTDQQKAT